MGYEMDPGQWWAIGWATGMFIGMLVMALGWCLRVIGRLWR